MMSTNPTPPRSGLHPVVILLGTMAAGSFLICGVCGVSLIAANQQSAVIDRRLEEEGLARKIAIEKAVEPLAKNPGVEWIRVGGRRFADVARSKDVVLVGRLRLYPDLDDVAAVAAGDHSTMVQVIPTNDTEVSYCEISFLADGSVVGDLTTLCPIR